MKRFVFLLVLFASLLVKAQGQMIGVYCDKTQIAPGEQITLRFVVTGGPIQQFYYTDDQDVYLINSMESNEGNVYQEFLSPRQDTRYTLKYVKPGSIDPQHESVFVRVSGNPVTVQTRFTPPTSCYDTDVEIYLLPHFWSNVPEYERLVKFDGPGVEGHYFYPSRSGGPGIKSIRAHILYDDADYGVTGEIRVIRYGTGVDEDSIQEASVYPNPTNGLLYLPESCKVIEIYSATSLLLRKFDNMTTIDISDMSAGMYIVKLVTEEHQQPTVMKIIKQ